MEIGVSARSMDSRKLAPVPTRAVPRQSPSAGRCWPIGGLKLSMVPRFQGSVTSLVASNTWTADQRAELASLATKAVDRAMEDYLESRAGS